jgi:septum formation protein
MRTEPGSLEVGYHVNRKPSPPLVLASGSPRRRDLLGRLGVPFQVAISDVSETADPALTPQEQAVALARRKARAVAHRLNSGLVLGADTIVVLDGDLLGKPRDDSDAARMLRALSGHEHRVITGIALIDASSGEEHSSSVSTLVRFRALSDEEIAAYVTSGEPCDKAGAYAIQGLGADMVAGFAGCFTNVVGLPLCETARVLKETGLSVATPAPVCRLPDGSPCPRLV